MATFETPRLIATTVTSNGALTPGRHTPVDATTGTVTMTLPATATPGAHLSVEKADSSTNAVNVFGKIRGVPGTTTSMVFLHSSITFVADSTGTSWNPVAGRTTEAALAAHYLGTPVTLTQAQYDALTPPAAGVLYLITA